TTVISPLSLPDALPIWPLGERDGKVALYLTDDLPLLHLPPSEQPDGELHQRLRSHLARYGASFFAELHLAAGSGPIGMVVDALRSEEHTSELQSLRHLV